MDEVEIRILAPGDEPAVESFLQPRLESSMFLLGNMRAGGLIDRGQPLQGTYAAAFDHDCIVAMAAHFWNDIVIVQAPTHLPQVVHVAVQASGRKVKGTQGLASQVDEVIDALNMNLSDDNIQMNERSGLFNLQLENLRIPDQLSRARLHGRRVEQRDQQTVIRWLVDNHVESLGGTESPELYDSCQTRLERAIQKGSMWVLEKDNHLLAISGFNSTLAKAVQIGPVYTPPQQRCQGFARCIVAASLLEARANGVCQAILFTGDENIPAVKAYQSLGFRRIDDYHILMLR